MDFLAPEGGGLRLLSLDGDNTRCMSQLVILGELMSRLEHDYGRPVRPCEYFHAITGVGASGIIAVFMGLLGMNIRETTEAFARICLAVFDPRRNSGNPVLRSDALVKEMEGILYELKLPPTTRLEGDVDLSAGCKISVCYSTKAVNSCRLFRNYKSRHHSYNPTIIEAVCAIWATPKILPSIRLGPKLMQEELVSAVHGYNNPTLEAINEAREAFTKDRKVSSILSLGTGKVERLSVSSTTATIRTAQETEIMAENLQRRFGTLGVYFRLSMEHAIKDDFVDLEAPFGVITALTQDYLAGDLVSRAVDNYVKASEHTSSINLDRICRTRVGGFKSSCGLPPLSSFFVTRTGPMNAISACLQNRIPGSPALAAVIGLGGTGKTQICLKYAYDHDDEYDHILFIDASSTESIEKNLVTRVRAMDRHLNPTNSEEALELLVRPEGNITRKWFIIMDNADDTKINLRKFIPSCDHGCVLITSRNASLGDMFAHNRIPLDVMSHDEAVEALLSAALGPLTSAKNVGPGTDCMISKVRTEKDWEYASIIVEELGCLPLAVIQAACYIKKQECLYDYPNLLKTSRDKILRWPSVQRDELKYAHSTYAAFDVTLEVLSPRALRLLGIISFFHFSGFPRQLIAIAASLGFSYQPIKYLGRPVEFQQSVEILQQTFCPNGTWDVMDLDELLEELLNYSLVTLVRVNSIVTLRFHPLLHGWANDRLSDLERPLFRDAAVRLVACCSSEDAFHLWQDLSSHVKPLLSTSTTLHINEKVALVRILEMEGDKSGTSLYWKQIRTILARNDDEADYSVTEAKEIDNSKDPPEGEDWNFRTEEAETRGKSVGLSTRLGGDPNYENHTLTAHIRTTHASLYLADAHDREGSGSWGLYLKRDVLYTREFNLGGHHLATVNAKASLARTLKRGRQGLTEAAALEDNVIRAIRVIRGPRHRDIVRALSERAATQMLNSEYNEARVLLTEALDMITTLVGSAHVATIRVMEQLAQCHTCAGNRKEGIRLTQQVMSLWRAIHGGMHANILNAMASLASSYSEQGQYVEAERIWRELSELRHEALGEKHESTLNALFWLALTLSEQERHKEAEALWREVVEGRRETLGLDHAATLGAVFSLAQTVFDQERPIEAELLWREVVDGRRRTIGDQDPSTLAAMNSLAETLCERGQHAEAEGFWRKVLDGRRSALGPWHPDTIETLESLALTVSEQNRHIEAESLWKEVVKGRRITLGKDHEETASAMQFLELIRRAIPDWQPPSVEATVPAGNVPSMSGTPEELAANPKLGDQLDVHPPVDAEELVLVSDIDETEPEVHSPGWQYVVAADEQGVVPEYNVDPTLGVSQEELVVNPSGDDESDVNSLIDIEVELVADTDETEPEARYLAWQLPMTTGVQYVVSGDDVGPILGVSQEESVVNPSGDSELDTQAPADAEELPPVTNIEKAGPEAPSPTAELSTSSDRTTGNPTLFHRVAGIVSWLAKEASWAL